MKIRFNDKIMQNNYEQLLKEGMHYKKAERKTIKIFMKYDKVKK